MIYYYKTLSGFIYKKDSCENGTWVNCMSPTAEEVAFLSEHFEIDMDFLKGALDEEEASRTDYDNGVILIVIDVPVEAKSDRMMMYYTTPLVIFLTSENVITVSLKGNDITNSFASGRVRNADTNDVSSFVLNIVLFVARKYLSYLNKIIKNSNRIEKTLKKSMKNKELIQLLEIKKSLVYFSSSLKTSKATLEKLFRVGLIAKDENNTELMDDVIIELKQAIEMTDTYMNIISGTMEAFASIISNNLNIVMKILASITLIISIPTVISGIYGMNTPGLPFMDCWWFPVVLSFLLMAISFKILKDKDML